MYYQHRQKRALTVVNKENGNKYHVQPGEPVLMTDEDAAYFLQQFSSDWQQGRSEVRNEESPPKARKAEKG